MAGCGGVSLLYAAVFLAARPLVGDSVSILSMAPVAVAAAFGGMRCGLVSGVLVGLVLNPALFALCGMSLSAAFSRPAAIIGAVTLIVLGAIVGRLRDLRLRLRGALEQARRTAAELAESEEGFRLMFETSSEGLGLVDLETGRFRLVNTSLCRLFGYTPEEFAAVTPRNLIRPEDAAREAGALTAVRDGGTLSGRDTVMITKDGRPLNVLVSAQPMRWQGRETIYTGIRDITVMKQMQAALEKKNRELLEFTDVVVHDLRKPLTAIKTTIELLTRGLARTDDSDGRELLEASESAVSYMEELLEDLLASARLEAGETKLERERFDLAEVLEEVIGRLKPEIDGKGIEVERDLRCPAIVADRRSLTRALMNLLGNAVSYIGVPARPRISVRCTETDAGWEITVEDNGMGIPEEQRETVFDKFKRGRNVGDVGGTGLGLSVVRAAVEAHGGRVWVESREGEGAAFHLIIGRQE
jgi:hypothetical protein